MNMRRADRETDRGLPLPDARRGGDEMRPALHRVGGLNSRQVRTAGH